MEAIAHLQLGDNFSRAYSKCYNVVKCVTHLTKGYSSHNVSSEAYCDSIEVTVVAPTSEDLELQDWFLSGTPRTGRLSFSLADIGNGAADIERSIEFEDAQCFRLNESYDIDNYNLRLLTLAFVPNVCEVEQHKYYLSGKQK